MELAALIISIVSFVISSIIGIGEIIENKKINNISLEAKYFDSLYKEYLLIKIPTDRKKISIDKDYRLINTGDLVNTLNEIRHISIYFQYTDKQFYENLKSALQELENHLVISEGKEMVGEEQTDFFKTTQDLITKIYKILLLKQKGKRQKKKLRNK